MILSLSIEKLQGYVIKQLSSFFPDDVDAFIEHSILKNALDRLDYCFSHVTLKHYFNGRQTRFNHLYSDHYVMFLWYLANTVWREMSNEQLASKLYYLNKCLHGLDCMYDTQLPDIFLLFHNSGTVLGKAHYSDFFVSLHGCTVGSHHGKYPHLEKGVALTAHSAIIGNCKIGKGVSISNHTSLFQTDVPDKYVVYRDVEGKLQIKLGKESYAQQFFNLDILK